MKRRRGKINKACKKEEHGQVERQKKKGGMEEEEEEEEEEKEEKKRSKKPYVPDEPVPYEPCLLLAKRNPLFVLVHLVIIFFSAGTTRLPALPTPTQLQPLTRV
jgi:hypothetical protein